MCGEFEYRIALAGLWTTAVLYGIYVMLFAGSIYVLVWQRPNKFYLITTTLIFILTSVYTVVGLILLLLTPESISSSIWENGDRGPCNLPESPTRIHQAFLGNSIGFLQNSINIVVFFVTDRLLIHRCFMLWNREKWVVAFLSALLLATTACNIVVLYYTGTFIVLQKHGLLSLQSGQALGCQADDIGNIGNWLSLATNIITTSLLGWKIWMMTRDIKTILGPNAVVRYYSAIAIVVESGALYSICLLLASVITYFHTIDPAVAGAFQAQLLAITPTLIIVRVGMGKGFDQVQDSLHANHIANSHVLASDNVHNVGTVSDIHFQTVQEAESMVSRSEHNGEGSRGISSMVKNKEVIGDGSAMV